MIGKFLAPYRLYLELAAIAAVLGFGAWFIHHERQIGANRVITAQEKAASKQKAEDQKLIDAATRELGDLRAQLASKLAAPPPADALHVRVCPNPRQTTAPAEVSRSSPGSDAASVPASAVAAADPGRDIGPGTEAILAAGDARIEYLQGYIRECQAKGFCAVEDTP